MKFNDNDIDMLLNFDGAAPSGQYNQLQWSVDFGVDATQLIAQIISTHEFFHSELNNTTVYGCLLQTYAHLSIQDSINKDAFQQILNDLVQQCREAHEIYATWLSITVFRNGNNDQIVLDVLTGNDLYLSYYEMGNQLVGGLPSLYLKQQVLTASIRFCFQSQIIAQTVIGNLTDFTPSMVRSSEFPSQRFRYIHEHLGPGIISSLVEVYINQKKGTPVFDLLRDAIEGREDTNLLLSDENNYVAEELMSYIEEFLQSHFNARGSASFESRAHLSFFKDLLERLSKDLLLIEQADLLVPNPTPDDYERSMLINFENEKILLSENALSAIVRHPDELTPEFHKNLLNGIGEDPHLFVIGRLSILLSDQYIFEDPLDQVWMEQINGPFTAIRYSYISEGKRVVVFIPFISPAALEEFLSCRPASVPIFGCVGISAAYQTVWWDQWGDFFEKQCQTSCLLLDVSPLYFVEHVLPQEDTVFYGKMIINTGERSYTAMVFQASSSNQIQATLVAPCSDIYGSVLHYYIKNRYKEFQLDVNFTKIDYKQIPAILSHLFKEERSFYFRSQNTHFL